MSPEAALRSDLSASDAVLGGLSSLATTTRFGPKEIARTPQTARGRRLGLTLRAGSGKQTANNLMALHVQRRALAGRR
jgi:hypothetical protein